MLRQMVRTGRSYYSQNELPLTFGLGRPHTWPAWRLSGHPALSMSTRMCLGIRPCTRSKGRAPMKLGALCPRSGRERGLLNWAALPTQSQSHPEQAPGAAPPLAAAPAPQHCQRLQPAERIWPTRTLASRPIRLSAMRKLCRPLRRRGRCSPLSRCPTATWPICTGARESQTRRRTWCGPWPRSCPMRTSSIVWARAMKSPRSWGWPCCSTARRPVSIRPSPARPTIWGVSC